MSEQNIDIYPLSNPPVDGPFMHIWRSAGFIGQLSSDDHLRSFTSILLAFLISRNEEVSDWLQDYINRNTNISLEQLYQQRDINREKKLEIDDLITSKKQPEGKPQFTQSAKMLFSNALVLSSETYSYKIDKQTLSTRHLLAAYFYSDIGAAHTRQLQSWGFDLQGIAREFLSLIEKKYPDELDTWAGLYQKRYSSEAPGDFAVEQEEGFEEDAVRMHDDRPASHTSDAFGRAAFANSLAVRLNEVWCENNQSSDDSAFMVHLHGPWGAGKTSMLNFLEVELTNTSQQNPKMKTWKVACFNAWQNQNINPPWWSLMDTVYRRVYSILKDNKQTYSAFKLKFNEHRRRLITGRGQYVLALAIMLWLALLLLLIPWGNIFSVLFQQSNLPALSVSLNDKLKTVSAIFGIIATVWAVVISISRSLFTGSAQAARSFVEHSADPMQQVRTNFHLLMDDIDSPVAIFVDDVDRCEASYVVKLLEGIQTLFCDRRVIYIIAADRRWLYSCFEQVYAEFSSSIHDPGRRLGYLFLEKAFQLSASIPRLSDSLRDSYWHKLILQTETLGEEEVKKTRDEAIQVALDADTQDKAMDALKKNDKNEVFQQALREAMVMRMAKQDVQESTRHFLRDFSPLMEPNPRSMKRLVNAYGIQISLAILARIPIEEDVQWRKKLALWTIVSLRWPLLEEALDNFPELADDIINSTVNKAKLSDELNSLLENYGVQQVFDGCVVGEKLDTQAVNKFTSLRSTSSTVGAVA